MAAEEEVEEEEQEEEGEKEEGEEGGDGGGGGGGVGGGGAGAGAGAPLDILRWIYCGALGIFTSSPTHPLDTLAILMHRNRAWWAP